MERSGGFLAQSRAWMPLHKLGTGAARASPCKETVMALDPRAHYALPSAPLLVNQLLALPLQAQLGVLRTIAPKIFAQLVPDQRDGFERDLHAELSRALHGE